MDNTAAFKSNDVIAGIHRASETIQANESYLNELDAVVGDGEHGFNLNRAFHRALAKLPELEAAPLSDLLRSIGMELIASGGGAGTTFYGMAFVAASKVVGDNESINIQLLSEMMSSALADIQKRGGANPGDKTLVDALAPAVEAIQVASSAGKMQIQAMEAAVAAAREGAEKTKELVGRKGRSLYAGQRALGVPDPGATSTYLIIASLANQPVETPL